MYYDCFGPGFRHWKNTCERFVKFVANWQTAKCANPIISASEDDPAVTLDFKTTMSSPFLFVESKPGDGLIHLAILPPSTPRLRTVKYQYPLKLVSPAPIRLEVDPTLLIHTVYLLTYGGGLVAGDSIDLRVILEPYTRLILLTQGSTKLFKSPSREIVSQQSLTVDIWPESALCYLPDPVQPFRNSCFEQQQSYIVHLPVDQKQRVGSLCVLDWVSNGRPANGEDWSFHRYVSRNELHLSQGSQRKLLLRDNLILDEQIASASLARRMDGMAVFGTMILHGHAFEGLGRFFMDEFKALPRIGARKWDSGSDDGNCEATEPRIAWRTERHRLEAANNVLWSAASLRGCVVVKFGAPVLEHARHWLHGMLLTEKSIVSSFGERALLCLRW